jgi:putative membrane protein
MALHGVVLMVGGHYTYAEMPLFDWIRDEFGLVRNHYDRLGHVAQGFIPAIVAREILVRASPLKAGGWLFFVTTCICLALSACYEMIEWWVAVASGDEAVSFLATQGDVWDTQWDMFLALLGALSSQMLLGRWHDLQLTRLRQDSL